MPSTITAVVPVPNVSDIWDHYSWNAYTLGQLWCNSFRFSLLNRRGLNRTSEILSVLLTFISQLNEMQGKSAELGESLYSVLNVLVSQLEEEIDFNYCCSTKTPHWITAVDENFRSHFLLIFHVYTRINMLNCTVRWMAFWKTLN